VHEHCLFSEPANNTVVPCGRGGNVRYAVLGRRCDPATMGLKKKGQDESAAQSQCLFASTQSDASWLPEHAFAHETADQSGSVCTATHPMTPMLLARFMPEAKFSYHCGERCEATCLTPPVNKD